KALPNSRLRSSPGVEPTREIAQEVSDTVFARIGAIAKPYRVVIVPGMPKTWSGKIMRRVLAAISNGQDPGDVSTLANPEVVDIITQLVR
ncbi:AMP-binding enzyme, partial [Paraburkholderia piptadeniae]|uniref:AMP-binding enzyme n=1 Tax=Paraburkholderia piptadeniae TaxID=1701573 RepID=UPI003F698582